AQHLVVWPLLIRHLEHPNDPGGDQAAREGRLLQQDQGIQRVAIAAQRVLDEPVVRGVPGRGEQHAIQPDPACVMVNLVLVPLALGDLDDDLDVHVTPSDRPTNLLSIVPITPDTGARAPCPATARGHAGGRRLPSGDASASTTTYG